MSTTVTLNIFSEGLPSLVSHTLRPRIARRITVTDNDFAAHTQLGHRLAIAA